MMEQPEDTTRLLAEIRDLQREQLSAYKEYLAEYERVSQQFVEMNRATAASYRESVASGRSLTWAIYLLIAICVGGNLFLFAQFSASR